MTRILLLAGSTEASALARRLVPLGHELIVSFAGRTRERVEMPGHVRVGGFGGAEGLARALEHERIEAVIDATHPFAARMPWNVSAACGLTGVPRLRVCRPPWEPTVADRWLEVASLDAAADAIETMAAQRIFLTTGRQELAPFAHLHDRWFLVRAIEPPEPMPLAHAELVLARGPFDEASELELMTRHGVEVVVSKNSGGHAAAAKLAAARELRLPVVMVQRPEMPAGPRAATVEEALAWLDCIEDEPAAQPGSG